MDDIKIDELARLKEKAKLLGISHHPSIGEEKLREKIREHLAESEEKAVKIDVTPGDVAEEPKKGKSIPRIENQRKQKFAEANKLVRIKISCLNPTKKDWEGELFTVANSVVGTFKKYVPFDAPDGWHVPQIIYNVIKARKCQIFFTVKDSSGRKIRKGKLINEFAIEELPPLTSQELKDLAQRQLMRDRGESLDV